VSLKRSRLAIRGGVLVGLLAFCSSLMALDRNALFDDANLLLLPRERPIPEVMLVDEQDKAFNTASLNGRWHLLFFGFTACPDACPTTLSDMRRLLGQLPAETRDQLQLVLVSADPARDTPDALRTYLGYYRAGFKGLTGEMAELQALSRALGLPFVPATETKGNYNVSHSSNIAIVDPDGRLRGHIRAPLQLEGLRKALPELIEAR
jgi:protein SCO1/2